jgi:hypothetical protein
MNTEVDIAGPLPAKWRKTRPLKMNPQIDRNRFAPLLNLIVRVFIICLFVQSVYSKSTMIQLLPDKTDFAPYLGALGPGKGVMHLSETPISIKIEDVKQGRMMC